MFLFISAGCREAGTVQFGAVRLKNNRHDFWEYKNGIIIGTVIEYGTVEHKASSPMQKLTLTPFSGIASIAQSPFTNAKSWPNFFQQYLPVSCKASSLMRKVKQADRLSTVLPGLCKASSPMWNSLPIYFVSTMSYFVQIHTTNTVMLYTLNSFSKMRVDLAA